MSEFAAGALHDLLDRDGERPITGSPLPPLWHWLAFLPKARHNDLGPDGHPRTGTFLPSTHGRARMYAGGRITREGTIRVGQAITRHSTVAQVKRKRGRSGELMLVTVDHRIGSAERAVGAGILEEQDLIYRPLPRPGAPVSSPGKNSAQPDINEDWSWGRDISIEPTFLFRFSALTYNAHRIHYDRDYATAHEGYPGLVVHGPLQAILIADAVERAHPHHFVSSFAFRAVAPAFDDHPLHIRLTTAETEDEVAEVRAHAFSGSRHTMSATVSLRPEPS